jgi:hypothetical protein
MRYTNAAEYVILFTTTYTAVLCTIWYFRRFK